MMSYDLGQRCQIIQVSCRSFFRMVHPMSFCIFDLGEAEGFFHQYSVSFFDGDHSTGDFMVCDGSGEDGGYLLPECMAVFMLAQRRNQGDKEQGDDVDASHNGSEGIK